LGWWTVESFVWSVGLARWYGGDAGENDPVRRGRFAVCSDIGAAGTTADALAVRRGPAEQLAEGEGGREASP
jgi:hypothetical protein